MAFKCCERLEIESLICLICYNICDIENGRDHVSGINHLPGHFRQDFCDTIERCNPQGTKRCPRKASAFWEVKSDNHCVPITAFWDNPNVLGQPGTYHRRDLSLQGMVGRGRTQNTRVGAPDFFGSGALSTPCRCDSQPGVPVMAIFRHHRFSEAADRVEAASAVASLLPLVAPNLAGVP
jgi:hypothetical protein